MLYANENGFPPRVWGPAFWEVIHTVAANFPCRPTERHKREHLAFYRLFARMLPCARCRSHFATLLKTKKYGLTREVVESRKSLFRWTVCVHDAVSRNLGKKKIETPRGGWYRMYESRRRIKNISA